MIYNYSDIYLYMNVTSLFQTVINYVQCFGHYTTNYVLCEHCFQGKHFLLNKLNTNI